MKLWVNVPLGPSREYLYDFIEETIPDVGERFDDTYVVLRKTIEGDLCTLDLSYSPLNYPDENEKE